MSGFLEQNFIFEINRCVRRVKLLIIKLLRERYSEKNVFDSARFKMPIIGMIGHVILSGIKPCHPLKLERVS